MKKVLIVDDDKSFLLSLIDGFKAYENQFSITTANDGLEAVSALQEHDISLVLTDLKMPNMDGFELVAHLSKTTPEIPIIVMTAFGTPQMESNLREMGTFQYIEKPIDFSLLVEKILKGLNPSSKSYISGVSLSSFLQLLELDRKTCTVIVHAGKQEGTIYFQDGEIFDAKWNNHTGSEAAFEIVSWENVEIELDNSCSVREAKITESLGFILLEGSRRQDENAAAADESGSLDSLNMEDIDLDLSAEGNLAGGIEEADTHEPVQTESSNPMLDQFIVMLSSFQGVDSATISAKDGKILHQSGNPGSHIANFVTYVAVAAEQIKMAIGAAGGQYSLFTTTDGAKLLILCGPEVIVGMQINSSAPPEPIADGLRPVLNRISLLS